MLSLRIIPFLVIIPFFAAHAIIDDLIDAVVLVECSNEMAEDDSAKMDNVIKEIPVHFRIDHLAVRMTVITFSHKRGSTMRERTVNEFNMSQCKQDTNSVAMSVALREAWTKLITDKSERKYSAKAIIFLLTNVSDKEETKARAKSVRSEGGSIWFLVAGTLKPEDLNYTVELAGSSKRVYKMNDFDQFKEEFAAAASTRRCETNETCAYNRQHRCVRFKWQPRKRGKNATCNSTIDYESGVPCNNAKCVGTCEMWPATSKETCRPNKTHITLARRRGEEPWLVKLVVKYCPEHVAFNCAYGDAIRKRPTPPQDVEKLEVFEIALVIILVVAFFVVGTIAVTSVRKARLGENSEPRNGNRKRRRMEYSERRKKRRRMVLSPPPSPGGLGSSVHVDSWDSEGSEGKKSPGRSSVHADSWDSEVSDVSPSIIKPDKKARRWNLFKPKPTKPPKPK